LNVRSWPIRDLTICAPSSTVSVLVLTFYLLQFGFIKEINKMAAESKEDKYEEEMKKLPT